MPSDKSALSTALSYAYLPDFAEYLRSQKLREYVETQLTIARELDIPLLKKFLHLSEEELIDYSMKVSYEFISFLAANDSATFLQNSLLDWKRNQIEFVEQSDIGLNDIFLISRMRKKTFLQFIKDYTDDISLVYSILEEMDDFFYTFDQEATKTYIELIQEKVLEDKYFRDKLVETSPGFYYLFDTVNDRQIHTTDKLFRYLGYPESEFNGNDRFFKTLIHPDDIQYAEEYVNTFKMMEDSDVHFFEYRIRAFDGSYRWMRNYESAFKRNDDHLVSEIIGVAFDITKERQITDKLLRHEEELLDAQEIAKMGSFTWDLITDQSTRTKQTESILELNENEKFETFMHRIHPLDKEYVSNAIKKAMTGDGRFDCEYRYVVGGHEKIILGKGIVKFENGMAVQMKGTVMDVTDKYMLINKLRNSEELYKQAQALNKIGNWSWNMEDSRFDYSDELIRIFCLENIREHILYDHYMERIHPDDKTSLLQLLRSHFQDKNLKDYYFRIQTTEGVEKIIYGQSQPVLNEDSRTYRIIGTCQDVTEQKMLEKSLFNKTIQLERSNESLQQFAYISSHDLKEPLRKIAVFSDKLMSLFDTGVNVQAKETLQRIIQSTTRMQRIIDEILSLSKITGENIFTKLNPGILFREIVEAIKTDHPDIKIQVSRCPELWGNETQFRQLFINLLSNSIKFRKKDVVPFIRFSCSVPAAEELQKLKLNPENKHICISYSDNGIGFGIESEQKIFTIFHRLHSRDKYEGTGIGLAICKKIVEHHHGDISAQGIPGEGATFRIIIPLQHPSQENTFN